MRAMILAAGLGTRLWPLTLERAKPAVPFLNRPLISYPVDYLVRFGIQEIVVNLHHKTETVQEAVLSHAPSSLRVHFSVEPEILGTGGALDKVRDLLAASTFVVINGKIITEINLAAAIETHRRKAALATLVLRPNLTRERFSEVEVDASGRVVRFGGFPQPDKSDEPPLMFTGIQILDPRIFDYIPRNQFSHTTTVVYPRAIERGETIAAHITSEPWYELSTLQRYLDTHLAFLQARGESYILGKNATIEKGAQVSESVLWDEVQVMQGALLRRCIVADQVIIPPEAPFDNVAIVRRELCPQSDQGEIIGGNLIVSI